MSDTFQVEEKLPLSKLLKTHPNLRAISPRTILRWTQRKTRGVQLEFVRVGGRAMSSHAAVDRFLAKLNTSPGATDSDAVSVPRSPSQRRRESDAAAAELAAAGA